MDDIEQRLDDVVWAYPEPHRALALQVRQLIRKTSDSLCLPGGVTETLKWGQPSWLPCRKGIGTTLRLGVHDSTHLGLFVHCQTTLIDEFRECLGDEVAFSGNRAVLLNVHKPLSEDVVTHCVTAALTYHRNKTR